MSFPISISLSEAANLSSAVKSLLAESSDDIVSMSAVSSIGAGMALRFKPKLMKALITSSIVATNGNSAVSLRESAAFHSVEKANNALFASTWCARGCAISSNRLCIEGVHS